MSSLPNSPTLSIGIVALLQHLTSCSPLHLALKPNPLLRRHTPPATLYNCLPLILLTSKYHSLVSLEIVHEMTVYCLERNGMCSFWSLSNKFIFTFIGGLKLPVLIALCGTWFLFEVTLKSFFFMKVILKTEMF